jgi:DNA-binding FadR family transcriptional regulator
MMNSEVMSVAVGMVGDGVGSRAEGAARRIAELVRRSAPGTRLGTKNELRELCEVSVGTFNESLRLLQSRGLVDVKPGPGGGLFVAEQSPLVRLGNSVLALDADAASVSDAVRIRDALDPLLIADAQDHSSPADLVAYRGQVAVMRAATEAQDPVEFLHANWRLHALIAAVNPSAMLRSLYTTLLDIVEAHTLAVLPVRDQPLAEVMRERYQVHADLVEAIAARDPEAVARLTHQHSLKRVTDG